MDQLALIRRLDNFLTPLYRRLPFSHYWWTLASLSGPGTTILDVACGDGRFMSMINSQRKYRVTGYDIFSPYLKKAAATGVYSKIVRGNIRRLPFRPKQFDICFCSQAIEHLTKNQGFALIDRLEKIAKKRVVFITPAGELPQDPYDGNIYQKHLSTWTAADFTARGYKVAGQGLKFLYGTGNAVKKWGVFSYLFSLLSLLAGPLLILFPDWGVYLFCTKDL